MSSTCDLYDGRWVKDNTYPLYQGRQCAWLAKNWACRNGLERPSFAFENFRWQPRQCDLPKFNASDFLGRSDPGRGRVRCIQPCRGVVP